MKMETTPGFCIIFTEGNKRKEREVDASEMQRRFIRQFGIRIGGRTAEYVLRHLKNGAAVATPQTIPVMGGDARTGKAVRSMIPLERLSEPS